MVFNSFGFKVHGVHTDVVLGNFQDSNLIIISEFQKIGQVFQVKKDLFHSAEGQEEIYSIHSLLGTDDERTVGAVRFLAEKLKVPKNSVFCLTLKDFSVPHLRAIATVLENKKNW